MPPVTPPMAPPEYPVIDGSSSTIQMHMAIRARLTDEHFSLEHSQTYAALERLVPGPGNDQPADVVLAVKYYDETLQDVQSRGADLVITPIAKEGFVFILHKDNPVDSLTQQQLKDIYSGKITNWKQLGGLDEDIVPYIRNWDSGSQTAMEEFMDGEEIIGEEDHVLFSMMFMLTTVEQNRAGIGYNIYSWSMVQHFDLMNLKTVKVDGTAPSNKTLSNSTYPLMVYTYSYYNRDNAKGKALTDWLLTEEGQSVITSGGYVGIFGELPPAELPYYHKDEDAAQNLVWEYYQDKRNNPTHTIGDFPWYAYSHSVRVTDREQTLAHSDGKAKLVTAMYITYFKPEDYGYDGEEERARFIVLTREKDGKFEVINEGEWEVGGNE